MEIWLRHPQHGVKCAHLESEALNDEKSGWERFDFRAEIAAPRAQEAEIAPVVDEPIKPTVAAGEMSSETPIHTPKKRGRKPKNRG